MPIANATAITLVATSSGMWTINLPPIIINSAGIIGSKTYIIRDRDGNASLANPITIQAGLNQFTQQQTFSDGSTSIQITQPFGFATIVEQSPWDATTYGVYRVVSTSEYPEGFANNFTQLLSISTGTAIPNLQLTNTTPASEPTQYKLFVSAGSLLFNTIQSMDTQTNSTLLQVTSNQFQSTFSSFAKYFETSTIITKGVSIGTISIPLVYVSDINAGFAFIQNSTNESGELSTSIIFADTTDSKFISSTYISTGIVSSLSSFVDRVDTTYVNPGILNYTNLYAKTLLTDEIKVSSFILSKSLISITNSTMNITMESLTTNPLQVIPAYVCTLNTNNICSFQATISSISTNQLIVNTNILDGTLFRTNGLSTSIISTGTLNIGSGNVSTFTTSSFFVSSPFVSCLTTSTLNMDRLSTGSIIVGSFSPASISTNLLTASTFQAKQMTISSLTANQMFVSSFYDRNARISTISANVISTGYISASFAYFSVMSTALYSTVSTIANVANMEGLSANTISTAQLRVGFGDLRSTFTSTLTGGLMSFTSNVVISSITADTICTTQFNVSTVSTNLIDTFVLRTSTVQNAFTNISSMYAQISTIVVNELRIPNAGTAVPTTNYLSAGSTLVGALDVSTIEWTTGPISTGLMKFDTLSLNTNLQTTNLVDNGGMNANGGGNVTSGLWVATGNTGGVSILLSQNGSNWSNASATNLFTTGRGIAYSAQQNLWVATGQGTVSTILLSQNGSNWSNASAANLFTTSGYGIAYSPQQNLWVAVGQGTGSKILLSQNGSNWSNASATNLFAIAGWGVTYSAQQNLWVATGQGTGSKILLSQNGSNWSNADSLNLFTQFGLGIAYSAQQNLWVVAGNTGGVPILLSQNGSNWSNANTTNLFTNTGRYVAYSAQQDLWVATGTNTSGGSTILLSQNGSNWSNASATNLFTIAGLGIAYSAQQNLWVANGQGTGSTILLSQNGSNWSNANAANLFTNFGAAVTFGQSFLQTDIANPNLNFYTQPSTLTAQDNTINNVLAYESTLAFNSTLYIQNNMNEVGINQINPTTALDVRSTMRGLGGSTTLSTLQVTFLSAPIVNVDTLSTSARISTPQFVFSTLTAANISSGFARISTLQVDQLLYSITSNFQQISSGVYEGGRFTPVSISTIGLSTGIVNTGSVSTNIMSTIDYLLARNQPSTVILLLPDTAQKNTPFTSLDGITFYSTITPVYNQGNGTNFSDAIPSYNSNGNFYVLPSQFNSTLYSSDLKTFNAFQTTQFTDGRALTYSYNTNIQLLAGYSTIGGGTGSIAAYKTGTSPLGTWTTNTGLTSLLNTKINFITFAGGRFVACGQGTSHTLATSTDGTTWTGLNKPIASNALCASFDGTNWVAVGYGIINNPCEYIAYQTNANITNPWIGISTNIPFLPTPGLIPRYIEWNGKYNVMCVSDPTQQSPGNLYVLSTPYTSVVFTSTITASNITTNQPFAKGNGFQRGAYRSVWNSEGGFWTASGSAFSGDGNRSTIATSFDGVFWTWNPSPIPAYPLTGGDYQYGGMCVGPNVLPIQLITLSNSSANINTLSTTFISTNRITAKFFNPISSISTLRISSVFGFFSTVGVVSTSGAWTLHVHGSTNASLGVYSNGNILTSDSNIKQGIQFADLSRCYSTMEALPLKRFKYLPEHSEGIQDKTQFGFLAQEVQPIFPKSLFGITNEETQSTILHVNFDQLYMNSFGATQHLMTIVEERQSTITSLYSTVETLQTQISTLNGNNM